MRTDGRAATVAAGKLTSIVATALAGALVLALAVTGTAAAGTTHRVVSEATYPLDLSAYKGRVYYWAGTPDAGKELWSSDGSADGTSMVRDIWPGPESSWPGGDSTLTVVDGVAYFPARSSDEGIELWRTDGTTAGTWQVKDIRPGPESSDVSLLTRVGTRLFFAADDGIHGRELWKSDGTAAGTKLVKDIWKGPEDLVPEAAHRVQGQALPQRQDPQTRPRALEERWDQGRHQTGEGPPHVGVVRPHHPGQGRLSTLLRGPKACRRQGAVRHRWHHGRDGPGQGHQGRSRRLAATTRCRARREALLQRGAARGQPRALAERRDQGRDADGQGRRGRAQGLVSQAPHRAENAAVLHRLKPSTGSELFRSNGKKSGTKLVANIAPGKAGSGPDLAHREGRLGVLHREHGGGRPGALGARTDPAPSRSATSTPGPPIPGPCI